jgi:hypothetical protein
MRKGFLNAATSGKPPPSTFQQRKASSMQRQLTIVRQQQARPARRIQPGDRVLIFDGLISQNLWVVVDEILVTGGRTKLRSGNMDFISMTVL